MFALGKIHSIKRITPIELQSSERLPKYMSFAFQSMEAINC